MDTYHEGDHVILSKNQQGFIRFKGNLPNKKGIFYGIEVTQGTGKNNGYFGGVRYFDCTEGQGLFLQKKRIISKVTETTNSTANKPKKQNKRRHSNDSDKCDLNSKSESKSESKSKSKSESNPSTKSESKSKPKRKSKTKKKDKGTGWKYPSWASDALRDDGSMWDSEKKALRGKLLDLKSIYDKAGYLPFAQREKLHAMGFTDTEIDGLYTF